ncbi:YybH family protein [Actinokineospora sp. NPDC004072]
MAASTEAFAPVADPHEHTANFAKAFNSGDPAAVVATMDPRAVFVRAPGDPVTGDDARKAVADFLALGLPMEIEDRHVYVADDTALIIADWRVEGTTPDGQQLSLQGSSTDVLRRGADGLWRSIIDNPHGTAAP